MKEKEEGAKPQKSGFLVRLTALAATAALLLGALTLVVYRDRFNLDALRRWFEYRELETSETGEAEPFTHAGGEQASFAYLKNGVLMASATGARYYSFSGELYAEEVRNLEHPVLSASKEAGVVYDAGGEDLFVFRGVEEAFQLDLGRRMEAVYYKSRSPEGPPSLPASPPSSTARRAGDAPCGTGTPPARGRRPPGGRRPRLHLLVPEPEHLTQIANAAVGDQSPEHRAGPPPAVELLRMLL